MNTEFIEIDGDIRPKVYFQKSHDLALLPKRNNDEPNTGDTGYDVYSVEDVLIPANGTAKVNIGIRVAYISKGYWFRIESRSGLFFKHGITAFPGVIDCSYRGILGIALINNSNADYQVHAGDKIAQLAIYKLNEAKIDWSDEISETNRGENGFGSSGR